MRSIDDWFGLTGAQEAAVPSRGRSRSTSEVVVLGCPFEDSDSYRSGAALGPAAIRRWAQTESAVTEDGVPIVGLRVVDVGDVEHDASNPDTRWQAIEAAAAAALSESPDSFLLALGGDHAITPPLVAATRAARGDLAYLMLDAHPDAFDAYEGNPLSHACVLTRLWDRSGLEPAASAVAGLRSMAAEEIPELERAGKSITASEWNEMGAGGIVDALDEVIAGRPLYLSFDIDVLDPSCAPGVSYPVAGGPTTRHALELLDELWRRHEVVAMDLVEVAPPLDPADITAAAAAHLILQVFGYVARD